MVLKKLRMLSNNKSAGPDDIHPTVLHETAESVSLPLSIIYNKSLKEGKQPTIWKDSHVIPIHKKGSKTDPSNYRPISLTSVPCKIMESIIRDEVIEHLMTNSLINDAQHGFVPGRSCITQLLTTLEDWTSVLDAGEDVDVIYLDIKKAFDSVPHLRLSSKLEAYNITGQIKDWISEFLHDRRQRVVINSAKSNWSKVKSGVPQGSVLAPILFALYINDLPENLKSKAKIYADDTKIYSTVTTPAQRNNIQADMKTLMKWSSEWQLEFNSEKSKVMHMGTRNAETSYIMGETIIQTTTEEKDLGVVIDKQLKFHGHVTYAANKANRVLTTIKRTFETRDQETIPLLYKGLVRPLLEYGNTVWSPRYITDIKAVERVQKRATKMITSLRQQPYIDRLRTLKLPSLEYRRRRGDMIQVYKIMYQKDRIDPDTFFQLAESTTRGHELKLNKPRHNTNLRGQIFSHRIVTDWNSLPAEVVRAPSLNSFKARLDRSWTNKKYINPFDK